MTRPTVTVQIGVDDAERLLFALEQPPTHGELYWDEDDGVIWLGSPDPSVERLIEAIRDALVRRPVPGPAVPGAERLATPPEG